MTAVTSTMLLRGLRAELARHHSSGIPDAHVLAAALHVSCGGLVLALVPAMPANGRAAAVAGVAVAAVVVGTIIAVLPWGRWRPTAVRWLIPEALTLVAVFNATMQEPALHGLFYFVTWGWVGLTQRPGTSTRFAPLLAVAYLAPAAASEPRAIVMSSLYVVPVCVVVGEVVALVADRLRRSEREVSASEARYASLLHHASEFIVVFGADHRIRFANAAFEGMVGLSDEALRSVRASTLVHPEEREEAVQWFRAAARPDETSEPRRLRVQNREGTWRLLELSVTDLRGDDAVDGVLLSGRDITDREASEAVLQAAAVTDPLTHLGNRVALERHVAERPAGTPVTLLFLDVDGFKVVNDSLGHTAGDRLLVQIARRLRARLDGLALCRTGGDEFVVVESSGEPGSGERIAAEVLLALADPFDLDGRSLRVAVSIGVAEGSGQMSAEELLRRADLAMYRAKRLGGGRWSVFDDDLAERAERRMRLESELRTALTRGELFLEYQPIVELASGRTIKAEALVRWEHPERGRLAPDEFLDVAEEAGLMGDLGSWVLDEALRTCAMWHRGGHPVGIAVNVSPAQLNMGFVGVVAAALLRHGVPARHLWLEITEHSLLDVDDCEAVLLALRELGVAIAIDDFGTGYSCLSYLHRLDVDALKIDRSFLGTSAQDQRGLVAAIVDMAHHLGLRAIAEGVETAHQVDLLCSLGCDLAQGYHFARSMPGADLLAVLYDGGAPGRATQPAQGNAVRSVG